MTTINSMSTLHSRGVYKPERMPVFTAVCGNYRHSYVVITGILSGLYKRLLYSSLFTEDIETHILNIHTADITIDS
jgi:hypothetical protein